MFALSSPEAVVFTNRELLLTFSMSWSSLWNTKFVHQLEWTDTTDGVFIIHCCTCTTGKTNSEYYMSGGTHPEGELWSAQPVHLTEPRRDTERRWAARALLWPTVRDRLCVLVSFWQSRAKQAGCGWRSHGLPPDSEFFLSQETVGSFRSAAGRRRAESEAACRNTRRQPYKPRPLSVRCCVEMCTPFIRSPAAASFQPSGCVALKCSPLDTEE